MNTLFEEGEVFMAKTESAVEVKVEPKTKPVTFTKENILKFKKYANRVDLLTVLLDEHKAYTMNEVDALIEKFMKGKVK